MTGPATTIVPATPVGGKSGNSGGNSAGNSTTNTSVTNTSNSTNSNASDKLKSRDFKLIASVVYNQNNPSDALVKEIEDFFDLIAADSLSDLAHSDGTELINTVEIPQGWKLRGVHRLRLRKFLDFVSVPGTTLPDDLTATKIADELSARAKAKELTSKSSSSSEHNVKLRLGEIQPFSGDRHEFWDWDDSVLDVFGRANMNSALTEKDYHDAKPDLSNAGFYCSHCFTSY